jgi:1,2-phenylacetyl-CoA epoxidase PaaB subunit
LSAKVDEQALAKAKIKKTRQIGPYSVWVVNGAYIRKNIDEEFTNFGEPFRFKFIPKNEFWLDVEAADDEAKFFIDHMLAMQRAMEHGKSYEEALDIGDRKEKSERRKAGDLKKVTHNYKDLPDPKTVHKKFVKKLDNGVAVWVVDGRMVRSVFDVDFTEGGHEYVYEYVPENEVWLDDDLIFEERSYVLLHELHERNLMAQGWTYNAAHADSSKIEHYCRENPDELHDKLRDEGWA